MRRLLVLDQLGLQDLSGRGEAQHLVSKVVSLVPGLFDAAFRSTRTSSRFDEKRHSARAGRWDCDRVERL